MGYELVSFKGMGDGVKININAEADIYDIAAELEHKINASKGFFGDGNCNIKFDGRRFALNEKRILKELMCRLLPLCNVNFAVAEKKEQNDWVVEYKEKYDKNSPVKDLDEQTKKSVKEEFISVFRSNRARFYQGEVHKGLTVRSDGHLILLGKVEKGAELIAVGNIVVIGGLYGTASAGCNGHNGSYIVAMDMKPEKLSISGTSQEYSYDLPEETDEPIISAADKKGFFDKFKKKDSEEAPVEEELSEFPAVALLKNNKIILDNFTHKIFTN